ncbi:MAG: DnaJ domain-containing protein [Rhodospirillales bacterium]
MVQIFILGLCLLIGGLILMRWYVSAQPVNILRAGKWALGFAGTALAVYLIVSGRIAQALFALPFYAPFLLGILRRIGMFRRAASMAGGASASTGQTSDVRTDWLTMRLDHDTGEMDGEVRRGRFAGSTLSALDLADLLLLHDEFDREDRESADLLEAFLDRRFPEWREEGEPASAGASGDSRKSAGRGGMSLAEAYEILGLDEGASAEDVRAAHKRLMKHAHPDNGGSTWLAQQVNEAKDVLLANL